MNIILGSGVNAFAAKHILGDSYKILSAGPSRFYKFNPVPGDNFIYTNENLKPLESVLSPLIGVKKADYRCAWSKGGSIIRGYNQFDAMMWLSKLFGIYTPGHIPYILQNRMEFKVYENRVNNLYSALYEKHKDSMSEFNLDSISKISPHNIHMKNGQIIEYDKLISTIPLDDLLKLMGCVDHGLKSVGVSAIRIRTSELNFEGFNQLWTVDPDISFYKSQIVKEDEYIFYFNFKVERPAQYISPYINDFDLLTGVWIEAAIPAGDLPYLNQLEDYGIIPLGMSAQWDFGMDFSSCLFRIMQIADGAIK